MASNSWLHLRDGDSFRAPFVWLRYGLGESKSTYIIKALLANSYVTLLR
jgi:hypothetical protein